MKPGDMTTEAIAARALNIAVSELEGILRGETLNHAALVISANEQLAKLKRANTRVQKEINVQGSGLKVIELNNKLKSLENEHLSDLEDAFRNVKFARESIQHFVISRNKCFGIAVSSICVNITLISYVVLSRGWLL